MLFRSRLNTAISVNVERAAQLERDNAQARATVSKLDAGRRIQDAAGKLDMVMPAAGSICFLKAQRSGPCSGGDAAQAGAGLDPAADLAPLAGAGAAGQSAAGTTVTGAAGVPPGATAPAGATVTPQAQAPVTTAPAQAGTAPATTPPVTAPAQTGAAAPAGTAPAAGTTPPATTQGAGATGGLVAGG